MAKRPRYANNLQPWPKGHATRTTLNLQPPTFNLQPSTFNQTTFNLQPNHLQPSTKPPSTFNQTTFNLQLNYDPYSSH
ncbi:MAG: restriction endonuclease [Moorea sp. SIO1F2]|uniref:restriction endonuclease n=1 Tax=Moorena sp. SIO1F2 TaxID=2607819 RepID=UPI0013B940C2|nr:restriction endonuclease [Moorena sp. SIO1F2]NET82999.1 restriction endonuclease [Moorena sp. SIO1F2]